MFTRYLFLSTRAVGHVCNTHCVQAYETFATRLTLSKHHLFLIDLDAGDSRHLSMQTGGCITNRLGHMSFYCFTFTFNVKPQAVFATVPHHNCTPLAQYTYLITSCRLSRTPCLADLHAFSN